MCGADRITSGGAVLMLIIPGVFLPVNPLALRNSSNPAVPLTPRSSQTNASKTRTPAGTAGTAWSGLSR